MSSEESKEQAQDNTEAVLSNNTSDENKTSEEEISEKFYKDDEVSNEKDSTKSDDGDKAVEKEVEDDKKDEVKDEDKKEAKEGDTDYSELKSLELEYLNDEDVDRIAQYSKERGLSIEDAKSLIEIQNDKIQKEVEKHDKFVEARDQQWQKNLKEHQEFGGENYNSTVRMARNFMKKFGSEKLAEELDASKYGNYDELIMMFARAAKEFEDDGLVRSGTRSAAKRDAAETLYGK